jgi:integrase
MGVTVVFNKKQQCWYLIDRHPSHKNGREAKKLGPSEQDRLGGLEIAARRNAERAEAAKAARAQPVRAGAPVYGRDAFPAMLEATQARRGAPHDANQESLLELHIRPHLGDVDLRLLTEDAVADYCRTLLAKPRKRTEGNCGRATVDNAMKLLGRCLNWLGKQRHLEFDVPVTGLRAIGKAVAKVAKAPPERQMVDAYSREEADAILAAVAERHEELYDFIFLALYSGARYGELVALEWSAVDFARGELHITKNIERVSYEVTSPKSGKGRVHFMGAALEGHLRQMADGRRRWRKPTDRVLLNAYGDPWRMGGPKSAWSRFRKHAAKIGMRTLHTHCWRHTYVSWGLHAGVPEGKIAEQIGDTVAAMNRHYRHWIRAEAHRGLVDFMGVPNARRAPQSAPVERRHMRSVPAAQ